jgi:hypothetical protein
LQTIGRDRIGAIEVMEHVDCKALPCEKGCGLSHAAVSSTGAMKSDYCRQTAAIVRGQETIEPDVFATTLKNKLGLGDGKHLTTRNAAVL